MNPKRAKNTHAVDIISGAEPPPTGSEPDNHWTWLRRGDDHTNYSEHQQAFECYDRAVAAIRAEKPLWGATEGLKNASVGKANSLSRLGAKRAGPALSKSRKVLSFLLYQKYG